MQYSDLELSLFSEQFSLLKKDDSSAIFRREDAARQETAVDKQKHNTGMKLTGLGVIALLLSPFSYKIMAGAGTNPFYGVPLWIMVGIVCVILGSVTRKNATTIKNIPASNTTISVTLNGEEVKSYKVVGDLDDNTEQLLSDIPAS